MITEAAIGVLKETGSSGNIIARNRFFNCASGLVLSPPLLARNVQSQRSDVTCWTLAPLPRGAE